MMMELLWSLAALSEDHYVFPMFFLLKARSPASVNRYCRNFSTWRGFFCPNRKFAMPISLVSLK